MIGQFGRMETSAPRKMRLNNRLRVSIGNRQSYIMQPPSQCSYHSNLQIFLVATALWQTGDIVLRGERVFNWHQSVLHFAIARSMAWELQDTQAVTFSVHRLLAETTLVTRCFIAFVLGILGSGTCSMSSPHPQLITINTQLSYSNHLKPNFLNFTQPNLPSQLFSTVVQQRWRC